MTTRYEDGQLAQLTPSELKDMQLGGNTRRKQRDNWAEFVETIRSQGILQSVVARLMPDGSFELLAGYGRRDAAIEAGITEIPALIRICDDATALEINLIENTARAELSFADQVLWSSRFISLYNGNVSSAAQRLGWSESKLRERLSLIPCTENVLDALDSGEITVRHALILAAFEETVQNNTLKKVIAEKWSASELRQRADKVQIPLSKAVFVRDECSTCIHNTELQSGLFGMADTALCSKSSCFHTKTKAALETKKSEAEEKYGVVVWLSQSLPQHRSTVTQTVVGQTQFNTGCFGCAERVVVIDDSPMGNTGAIMESQCTNLACLNDCTTSYEKFVAAQQVEQAATDLATDDADDQEINESVTDNVKSITAKAPVSNNGGSISNVLVETHWRELREIGGKVLKTNEKFALVMQLIGLIDISKFKVIGNPADKMPMLMAKPDEELKTMIAQMVDYIATKSSTVCGYKTEQLVTASMLAVDGGEDTLIQEWLPSEATLKQYTTTGLEQIIVLTGLDKHCEALEKGAGKKLVKGTKADVIKAILAVKDFDWTGFAPPAYLKLIKSLKDKTKKAA